MNRRDGKRFYYEYWKELKFFMKQHKLEKGPYMKVMREHFIETMVRHEQIREKDG
jgi:hypothetical protein